MFGFVLTKHSLHGDTGCLFQTFINLFAKRVNTKGKCRNESVCVKSSKYIRSEGRERKKGGTGGVNS